MSPFLFSADHAHTEMGRRARAAMTVADASVLSMAASGEATSISDLFADYAAARARNDRFRMAAIRLAAGPQLLDELDGFNYPAAA